MKAVIMFVTPLEYLKHHKVTIEMTLSEYGTDHPDAEEFTKKLNQYDRAIEILENTGGL